ncbi:uncharacterized protein [Nothobranchius furzeri]|uniref:Flocculation protein FLO11-like n=2 Tax=Nothobranchius furzeri TaxID=105023 RepID=A0A9D3BT48_NOTFU|nr:uncharacterized protein LOC107375071 isoform X2 [Nothobranchius furzeri]KAF7217688.1 flocculation protein FLO11-like [Nothobranchius furzeri]
MELLKITLLFVLVVIISAKPTPPDADIPDEDQSQETTSGTETSSSSTGSKDSKESTESNSLEESNSSEEGPDVLTGPPTVVMTTVAMTTTTSGDGSTMTPEPGTAGTSGPTAMVIDTTVETGTAPDVTTPCNTTLCFTEKVPTPAPVTQNRGDM